MTDSTLWGLPNRAPTFTDRLGSDSSAVADTSHNTFTQVQTLMFSTSVVLIDGSTATTQAVGNNAALLATTAFVQNELTDTVPVAQEDILAITGDGQTAFTLSTTPISDEAFALYLNGQLRTITTDYTRAGTALTWTDPGGLTLKTTDELKARYNATSSAIESPTETNYVYAFDDTLQSIALASTWQDIDFSTNVQIDGWSHTVSTADFTCNATGKYMAIVTTYYEKTAGAPSFIEFRALANAIEIPGSHSSVDLLSNNFISSASFDFIFDITTSDVFKIQMQSPLTQTRLNQHTLPEPTVRLRIVRIA